MSTEAKAQREWTRSGMLKEWQRLLEALQANQADLVHLGALSTELETLLSQVKHLVQCQAALKASKEEATQRLTVLLADCQRLATVLRFTLKHHYGPTADKLEDFGIQPRPSSLKSRQVRA
jgi:diadenosine tetraphosphatase ApaH/serine/threonine PP2A family protein phosphatase